MKAKLIEQLQSALKRVNEYERKYFETMTKLVDAKTKLSLRRAELIKDDKINGRNEEQREAQLLQHAKTEFLAVKSFEKQLDLLKIDYRNAEREWETLMAISKLGE